ncbi:MAG: hypothetical protein H8E66_02205 [Planctomycetes bacterium]|nr:hypothetical protein [Planctomycetota bacterium]
MSDSFDPYHVWLGIPPEEQPPDHYRLLGLRQFEENRDVISHAAEQRMSHLRSMQAGPRSEQTQIILNQLAAARASLLTPDQKSAYDAKLHDQSKPKSLSANVPPIPSYENLEPPRPSSSGTGVANPMVMLVLGGIAAGIFLMFVIAVGLAWQFNGPAAAESRDDFQAATNTKSFREVTPNAQNDRSIESPLPEAIDPQLTEPEPPIIVESPREPPAVVQTDQSVEAASIEPVAPMVTESPPPVAVNPSITPQTGEDKRPTAAPVEAVPKRDFAVRLKDVGDAIVLENTADLFSFNREFTVELWARFHPTPDPHSIVGNQVSLDDGGSVGWLLHIPGPVQRDKGRYITLSGVVGFGSPLPISKSEWRHIAVCGESSSVHVFVDGSLVLTESNASDLWPSCNGNIMIGRNPLNKNYRMMGQNKLPHNIGDFRGDIRALRINAKCLYEEDFVPPSSFERNSDDLVALDFTTGDGDTVSDLSGNSHDGKIVSGEWIALPEAHPDVEPLSNVVVSGISRKLNHNGYRFRSPEADEFASEYVRKGYRRIEQQRIVVNRTVAAPTVFLGQGVELYANVHAEVAIVAQSVELYGLVRGPLTVRAQVIRIHPDAVIQGNLHVESAQSIWIDGRVEGAIIGEYGNIRWMPNSQAGEG